MIIIFIVSLLATASIVIYSWMNGISPMPSSKIAKKQIIDSIPLNTQGEIVDLGSGWGTLTFPIAKAFPNANIIGYENSPVPYLFSKLRKVFSKSKNIKIKRKNFYNESLKNTSTIVCYLYPGAMNKLEEKFKELQSETIIISNSFALPNKKPIATKSLQDLFKTKIYIYKT